MVLSLKSGRGRNRVVREVAGITTLSRRDSRPYLNELLKSTACCHIDTPLLSVMF
jgi:hypothetical protein